jgi:hypothetical protein
LWLHFSITILITSVFHTCRYAACANAFGIEAKDILYCTVNTQQPDMSKLLGSVFLLVYVVVFARVNISHMVILLVFVAMLLT